MSVTMQFNILNYISFDHSKNLFPDFCLTEENLFVFDKITTIYLSIQIETLFKPTHGQLTTGANVKLPSHENFITMVNRCSCDGYDQMTILLACSFKNYTDINLISIRRQLIRLNSSLHVFAFDILCSSTDVQISENSFYKQKIQNLRIYFSLKPFPKT